MNVYLSLAAILLISLLFSRICLKLNLPALLGYLLTGLLLGPCILNWIDASLLSFSGVIRQFALIIILCRAGLGLDFATLRKNGLSVLLLCFVPATFEIIGYALLGPILGLDRMESVLLGTVMAAVSPAVVVPRMLKYQQEGYGAKKGICMMIMAAASVDDVYVITLFSSALLMVSAQSISLGSIAGIPISVVTGILAGALMAGLLKAVLKRIELSSVMKTLLILAVCFGLVGAETCIKSLIPYSALLSVISLCAFLANDANHKMKEQIPALKNSMNSLWQAGEMFLFVMVAAGVDLSYASAHVLPIVLCIAAALVFRMAGVYIALLPSDLSWKERLFCMIAYCPKATVQAGIGATALGMGLACGNMILSAAVLSILLTAPIGALAIDTSVKKLLIKEAV